MVNISVAKLGGLSLILGPVIAVVFYFIQPGVLLVDSADPADAAASIGALVSNSELTHLSAFVIPLGLVMMLFGISVVQGRVRDTGNGDALSRFGLQLISIAVIGWIVSQGLNQVLAGNAREAAGAVYAVGQGIALTSALVASLGFLSFSLGVSNRDDFNKPAACVVAIVSLVAMVFVIIGTSDSSQLELTTAIVGIAYLVWTVWAIVLGLDLVKQE